MECQCSENVSRRKGQRQAAGTIKTKAKAGNQMSERRRGWGRDSHFVLEEAAAAAGMLHAVAG